MANEELPPSPATRSLEDVLKAKKEAAAAKERQEKEGADQEQRERGQSRRDELQKTHDDLLVVRTSIFGDSEFAEEVAEHGAAVRGRGQAERAIDTRIADLEQVRLEIPEEREKVAAEIIKEKQVAEFLSALLKQAEAKRYGKDPSFQEVYDILKNKFYQEPVLWENRDLQRSVAERLAIDKNNAQFAEFFSAYSALQEKMREAGLDEGSNVRSVEETIHELSKASADFAHSPEGRFIVEPGYGNNDYRVVDADFEEQIVTAHAERGGRATRIQALQTELQNLGRRPGGIFSGAAKKTWDTEYARIGAALKEEEDAEKSSAQRAAGSANKKKRIEIKIGPVAGRRIHDRFGQEAQTGQALALMLQTERARIAPILNEMGKLNLRFSHSVWRS